MNTCLHQLGLRSLIFCLALLCLSGIVGLAFGQSSSPGENQRSHLFREIETSLKVEPGSTVVEFTITNRSQDTRYLLVPLDLTPFRINLTAKGGGPLAMTPKGRHDLTEPGAGSMRIISLKAGVPWTYKIDLGPLFEFPKNEDVHCEVSRHVRFNDPDVRPGDMEWIPFPPAIIRTGSPIAPPTTNSTPKIHTPAPKVVQKSAEPESQSPLHADAPAMPASHGSTSSPPWSILWVLVVGAAGLLWLLVKKRK